MESKKRAELKIDYVGEDENKIGLTTEDYEALVGISMPIELSLEEEWDAKLVLFGHSGKPAVRVFIDYDSDNDELKIIERQGKKKIRHSLPTHADGGPIPISDILQWMKNSIPTIQDWEHS